MHFSLSESDNKKLLSLFKQDEDNIDYFMYLSSVILRNKQYVTNKVNEVETDFDKKNLAFDMLEREHPIKNDFIKKNIRWDTNLLNEKDYEFNPYLLALKNLTFKEKGWTLTRQIRKAYTLCPYEEEYAYGANYAMKMALAMFKQDYIYPSICLYDTEWMSLNQHEIRTMEIPIQLARGKVLTLGLGLGYYAYMVSLKEEVKEVHIVEMDLELIQLFNKHLLPLFPHPEKIHIHKADAFYFIKDIKDKDYDFIFSDLWHDASDGTDAYLKLKKHFINFKCTQCSYWIENSIISHLRMMVINVMKHEYYDLKEPLDEFSSGIKDKLVNYTIKTTNDIDSLLNLEGLNHIFFN